MATSSATRNRKICKTRNVKKWTTSILKGKAEGLKNPSKLRSYRCEKGISQEIIAKKAGLTISTYCAIERGHRPVDNKRAHKLASIFESQIQHLFSTKENARGKTVYVAAR